MAWHVRYGEGDASGFPPRYASTARAGSAIGASAYFMREDDRRRGSSYARPDPTGHVIAKQARRAFEASRGEDAVGESVRYVRSLRYLPRERGEVQDAVVSGEAKMSSSSEASHHPTSSNEPSDSGGHRGVSSFGFGYPTGDGGVGAFEFPATRSVMWDPSAVDETTHISAAAHVATASLGAGASKSLAELLLRAETEPVTVEDNGKKVDSIDSISAKGALVASRRVLDRRGEFRASAALEIFAVKKGDGKAAQDAETETRVEPESDGGVRSEAWSSTVAIAIASAPPESSTREALEAMTSFPSASPSSRRDANENERILEDEETLAEKTRVSALAPLRVATPWRARLAATLVKNKNDDIELIVSARVRVPTAVFAATPIAPPRVADSPLLRALVAAQTRAPRAPIGSGFLTMDRTRRLMLLDETDSASLALPTVGVWVSGVTHVTHLAVWAACHRYFSSDALVDKATQRGAFLCLLFPPAPELSELEVSKSDTKVGRTARAPPPACHDVRLVEPRGARTPRTHADFAATFECVPGEASVRARLAPPPATRAERNADKSVFDDKSVSRDEAEAEASADATDSSRVTLRRRASSSSKEKDASLSLSTPKPSSSILTPFSETKRQSASPDWAPVYGAAPRTAYEAAAAAAAARAAAANAKLAASRGSTPSSLLSPATLSPIKPQPRGASSAVSSFSSSFPLEGAARVVVEEQQRVIAELRNAVAFLETEMAQLTRPISAREREAQARDLLGGLEGATGFEPRREAEDDADGDESSSRGDAKGAFSSSPSPSSKSPLRKALAFARGGEATRSTDKKAAEADAAADASFRSDEVDAMYGMDTPEGSGDEKTRQESGEKAAKETKASKKAAREERRAARREKKAKKAKKKSESGGDGAESLLFPNEKADEGEEEEEEAAEEEEEDVREASKKDAAAAAAAADAAEARALAHRDAATASFAATRALFPAAPDGIPPEFPEPPSSFMPSQPARRFCESPYVESAEEVCEKGERVADPLPGGGARYPAEPHLAHAATGYAFADDAENDPGSDTSDTDALLNASSLMVDPEAMDEETAARRAAATRRDAAFRLTENAEGASSFSEREPFVADGGEYKSTESDARRATVRAGLDPMYPVIDCSFEDEGADDEDERVEELVEKYAENDAGRNAVVAEEDDDADDAT